MLEAFTDIELSKTEVSQACPEISEVAFSIVPTNVNLADYDFDVSINDEKKGFLGFEGSNLSVKGRATLSDESARSISFTAPVTKFRLEVGFIAEDNPEVIEINPKAQKPTVKAFSYEVGSINFENDYTLSSACMQELHEGLIEGVLNKYDSLWDGDLDSLSTMPIESFLPMILIRHVGGFAREQIISPASIEYGFDPEMLFERIRPTPSKKSGMLKEINSEFTTQTEGAEPVMVSLIIDENAINSFILEFVLVERAFSVRDFLKVDPRTAEVLTQMHTKSLAVILPSVVEEFGDGRPIDFYISMSHSLLGNKLDVKPSGFQMDKNGNFKFVFNVSVTLLVEQKGSRGKWDEARSIYASFTAKGKVTTNTTNKNGDKMLTLHPKSAEISQLKIYNKAGTEMELEQMLLTSGFNMQMDTVFKLVKPFDLPMKNLPTPPEMECLGIGLTNFDIQFKKGFLEATCGYKKVPTPRDSQLCEKFMAALKEGPKNAKENVDKLFGGKSAKEFIKDKQS